MTAILSSSRPYLRIPIDGPPGWNPATDGTTAEVALIADAGTEPADADYHPASWDATAPRPTVVLLVGPGGVVTYPAGNYFAFVRLTAGAERPVLPSSRVRIGFP